VVSVAFHWTDKKRCDYWAVVSKDAVVEDEQSYFVFGEY